MKPRVEKFAQADLQRTELAALGVGVVDEDAPFASTMGVRASAFWPATTMTACVSGWSATMAAESRVLRWLRGCVRSGRRPGKQRLVASHARGFAGGEDEAAKIGHRLQCSDSCQMLVRMSSSYCCCRAMSSSAVSRLQRGCGALWNQLMWGSARSALRRMAMSSATMETAISSGVTAPMSRPTGECTRSKSSGLSLQRQFAEDGDGFAVGADHADVARRGLHGPAQNAHVVAMAARGDDDVGRFAGSEFGESLVKVAAMTCRAGESARRWRRLRGRRRR